ncbi:hypothetical protein KS4_33830 [Poriferisphaera corsica]|uniref:Uncharacterized protein n=1 Tax=Poriferisphaera corsica TaxID=2528020 RepID=A0A517YYJ3_9BACT|nr:hypothetical protein [Poriferisphaera corsica]QDU35302.1 hypothetical protein KS4_33830 [Poriferisphaera corsica]
MDRDRFVQIIAVLFAVSALVGATMLVPTINKQRRDLELSFDLQQGDNLPPKYALASALLGSFRGLAVDALWYRIERLKQQGKFNEANTLAQWITTLQPRFPQVWAFQAWNLAYNVSVKTNTPTERYDWVSKGIRLLRDEGIPKNRQSIRLYRELAWIFFHKMGKTADDMHWFYKRKLAEEWQEFLGAPTDGATTQQVLDQFAPIAKAIDRYFVLPRLTREARNELDHLIESVPEFKDGLTKVRDLTSVRVADQLDDYRNVYGRSRPDLIEKLSLLEQLIDEQSKRNNLNKLDVLYGDTPEAQSVVNSLAENGMALNEETLRRFGQMIVALRYNEPTRLVEMLVDKNETQLAMVVQLLTDESPSTQMGVNAILAYMRAKVLWENYHMDPGVMYELMEMYGPLDWRHPASHGVYWAFLGVRVSGELQDTTRIDLLNTDRNVIHGLQELMYLGKVSYDPGLTRIDLLPDPRFIPKYELAMVNSLKRIRGADFTLKKGTINEFENGHENFLIKAIVYSYLYGAEKQAAEYYAKSRNLYGDKGHNVRMGRYNMPLEDFVMSELKQDMDMQTQVVQFIDAMIGKALMEGLANGRLDVFSKFMKMSRVAFNEYTKDKLVDPKAEQARQKLGTFDQVFGNTYAKYMKAPSIELRLKAKVYANTPTVWREISYPNFRKALSQQCEARGLDFAAIFPAPPSIAEKEVVAPKDKGGKIKSQKTIQRK